MASKEQGWRPRARAKSERGPLGFAAGGKTKRVRRKEKKRGRGVERLEVHTNKVGKVTLS
jgi:hypothetical protein